MENIKHLKFDATWAHYNDVKQDHPQKVMKDLGISYTHSTPQSISECWWFWNCKNIPNELPQFLSVLDADPIKCIGWGLSEKEAEAIVNYK